MSSKINGRNMLLWATLFILHSSLFISCSDFYDPSTEDELAGDEYISSQTEMYTGFLGIMTKMQAVGDKEILLTETRGELIEVTNNPTPELQAVYNYEPNLQGNPYADPAGYYEVIIACNDFIQKMKEFRSNPIVTDEVYKPLVSSAVRVKVWAYKTLAEIYGQAVWFDDPVAGVTEIKDNDKFELMPLAVLVDKCLKTLETGMDGAAVTDEIDWIAWLDPANVTNVAGSQYRKWTYTVPPYAGLHAELCLWKGAVLDASLQEAKSYYKQAADELLVALNKVIDEGKGSNREDPGSDVYWLPSGATPGHYTSIWNYAQPYPYESVSAIIYDYKNNQTNALLKHFTKEYPNKYLLRPSQIGIDRFLDTKFNPGATTNDTRYKCVFGDVNSGKPYIAKFRPNGTIRPYAYQDDCHIYVYRATQYHMMLAEALNHLQRFIAFNGVFNTGVKNTDFDANDPEWDGFGSKYDPTKCDWTKTNTFKDGTRKYDSEGIRGCVQSIPRTISDSRLNPNTLRINDMAILDESMLEFAAEGKVYPMMNRMAVRYNDPKIIADRVCPKYEAVGKDAEVRAKIMAGGFWVPYDLGIK